MVNARKERKTSGAWATETEALEALAKRQREIGAGLLERPARTLGEVAEEYLAYNADEICRLLEACRVSRDHGKALPEG